MRYFYLSFACLGLWARTAQGQAADSLATDSSSYVVAPDERWVNSQTDSTGECTEILHWSGPGGLVRVFHPSGRLKEYRPYADLLAGKLHGVATTWYDDGQLAVHQTFLRGQRDGMLLAYYPSGQLKRQTQYTNGYESLGQCFAPTGEPLSFFPYERPPLYPGGQLQLIKEISQQMRRWQPDRTLMLSEAQLHISFQVDEDGQVENPQVTITDEQYMIRLDASARHSLQKATAEGLTSLVSRVQHGLTTLAKPFYPGKRDGAAVRWQYYLTIPFTCNKSRF